MMKLYTIKGLASVWDEDGVQMPTHIVKSKFVLEADLPEVIRKARLEAATEALLSSTTIIGYSEQEAALVAAEIAERVADKLQGGTL